MRGGRAAGAIGIGWRSGVGMVVLAAALAGCTSTANRPAVNSSAGSSAVGSSAAARSSTSNASPTTAAPASSAAPSGEMSFSFAGDVHFEERTAVRLADDPDTVFGVAQPVLSKADLTMVNLETAITNGGDQQGKSFTFRAPPSALTALRAGGVDVATMANNHGADYGASGLSDTLAAIHSSGFPVIGIGANADAAFRPYTTTVNGVRLAVFAASQVQDETLANFSAGDDSAGIASAYSPRLVAGVRAAKSAGYTVIVYVHWGTEYTTCPNGDQRALADTLAAAGATAVVGTHAHELQGAGWRSDGVYVAYGLSNYLWWRSFGNLQDDAGVLTLDIVPGHVVEAQFSPAHLDDTGVPVPATGSQATRIDDEWQSDRQCAGLLAQQPH